MIFVTSADKPQMFVILTEQDVNNIRSQRTLTVTRQSTKGYMFNELVIGYGRNKKEIGKIFLAAGHKVNLEELPNPPPVPGEVKCKDCDGSMPAYLLIEGSCIICWKEKAEYYRGLYKEYLKREEVSNEQRTS